MTSKERGETPELTELVELELHLSGLTAEPTREDARGHAVS